MVETRTLGRQGLTVPALGLGCMGMSEFYGEADEAESIATIHRSIDLGMTFLDTADVYGFGRNEELVGRAIKGRRGEVILATKFGIVRDATNRSARGVNGRPEYVRQQCEASLKRLGVDIAKAKGVKASQLALAWVLARGKDIVPIPGTKRRSYLEENAGALAIELTPADLAQIDEVAPKGAAAGTRYPEPMMRLVNV